MERNISLPLALIERNISLPLALSFVCLSVSLSVAVSLSLSRSLVPAALGDRGDEAPSIAVAQHALLARSQLALFDVGKRLAEHLVLSAKVVLVLDDVRCKVLVCCAVYL
jgi:hypothetical protein